MLSFSPYKLYSCHSQPRENICLASPWMHEGVFPSRMGDDSVQAMQRELLIVQLDFCHLGPWACTVQS